MKPQSALKHLLAISALNMSVTAQTVRLTFDNDQSDYGAYEISGTETELNLTRAGGLIATNDFTELDGLTAETYWISGPPLSSYNPIEFSISTSGGSAKVDSTALDVGGGGIDTGESITFVFDRNIVISEFDFAEIGTAEFAAVTIAGSTQSFGTSSGDTHHGSFSLNQGQALRFDFAGSHGADYDIQGFTFAVVVPEPRSYATLAGSCALALAILRRRRPID
jgi:hypothetical protein